MDEISSLKIELASKKVQGTPKISKTKGPLTRGQKKRKADSETEKPEPIKKQKESKVRKVRLTIAEQMKESHFKLEAIEAYKYLDEASKKKIEEFIQKAEPG